jgi:hypothetical protein
MTHRWLVEALGDQTLLESLQTGRTVAPAAWGAALERVRLHKYPDLPADEGHRRVGFELGNAFLASSVGSRITETLGMLTLERLMESLYPAMFVRLRAGFDVSFVSAADGGVVTVKGPLAAPAQQTLGFTQAVTAQLPRPCEVALGPCDATTLTLVLRHVRP